MWMSGKNLLLEDTLRTELVYDKNNDKNDEVNNLIYKPHVAKS